MMFRRTRFIPHDQDREDQRAEERAERRALKTDDSVILPETTGLARFGGKDPADDEYQSLDAFVEWMFDEDLEEYDFGDLNCLCWNLGLRSQQVKADLAGWGLTLKVRRHVRHTRGINANPHDRWHGPGACPTHGGGGGACLVGVADIG